MEFNPLVRLPFAARARALSHIFYILEFSPTFSPQAPLCLLFGFIPSLPPPFPLFLLPSSCVSKLPWLYMSSLYTAPLVRYFRFSSSASSVGKGKSKLVRRIRRCLAVQRLRLNIACYKYLIRLCKCVCTRCSIYWKRVNARKGTFLYYKIDVNILLERERIDEKNNCITLIITNYPIIEQIDRSF